MNNQQVIDRIGPKLVDAGFKLGNATQSYLRFLFNLNTTPGVNSITFNVLQTDGNIVATEQRLQITDLFTITHWSLQLIKVGTTSTPSAAEISRGILRTYPNPQIFTGTNEADNLMNIYNGNTSVTIDRDKKIDAFDNYRFYRVDTAQQLLGMTTAAPAAPTGATAAYSRDSYPSPNYAYAELDPNITLNGAGSNQITVSLPDTSTLTGTTSCNFLVLTCRGIKWQNASKLNG